MRFFVVVFFTLLAVPDVACAEKPPVRLFTPTAKGNPMLNLSEPLVFQQGSDTLWLPVCTPEDACPCDLPCGGACTGGPDGTETFCFDLYEPWIPRWAYYGSEGTPYFSPSSGNGWTTLDVKSLSSPTGRTFWHLDTYEAYGPGGYSWWCGALTGELCVDWGNAPGYGDEWKQYLVLQPDLAGVSPGDTVALECQVRYDTECDYDYAYIAYSNDLGTTWITLATFCGTSRGYPVAEGMDCSTNCGGDYYESGDCNRDPGVFPKWNTFPRTDIPPGSNYMIAAEPASFLICFRFESDAAWSDEDGRGDTDGAFFVDDVTVKTPNGDTLEFEDMDYDFEPSRWTIMNPPSICNLWWMAFDPDPPREQPQCICDLNEWWMWTACPFVDNTWRIPEENNGFAYRLVTPRIWTGWGEPHVPKEYAGLVVQSDVFACLREQTCDYYDTKVNVYSVNTASGEPGWCGWENIDGCVYSGGCQAWMIDSNEGLGRFLGAHIDSVRYAWDIMDLGNTGEFCWTTQSPPPHSKTQVLVDNVSFGFYDASETQFYARAIDMFQDTFDTLTVAHNALCANGDMPKVLATQESLMVDIHDMNGLTGPGAWVRLYFSTDRGASWGYNNMVLRYPDPNDPNLGGTYIGSISPAEAGQGASWRPGTEVWYYVEVRDDLQSLAYWPSTAAPGQPPPGMEYLNNYFEFSILPGTYDLYWDDTLEGRRLLLVDDFGRADYDPATGEWRDTEDIYESVLRELGYCYDKYDVNGASAGLSNEPWGIVWGPDPMMPDSLVRRYDALIWSTSRLYENTVLESTQCIIRDFIFRGGNVFLCGNHMGVEMTDYGRWSEEAADTCEFYECLLGANIGIPAESAPGSRVPTLCATGFPDSMPPGSEISPSDTFQFYLGCPLNECHDLVLIYECLAFFSHPQPYLVYCAGHDEPADPVLALYNRTGPLSMPWFPGGQVVYLSIDLATMMAARDGGGRADLMFDVLSNLFGIVPGCWIDVSVGDEHVAEAPTYVLSQNRPNPFNPHTDIDYAVHNPGRVTLRIYNVEGRAVRTLVDQDVRPGRYTAHWDGIDDGGMPVSSGIYFCKLKAGDFCATRKMVLLK